MQTDSPQFLSEVLDFVQRGFIIEFYMLDDIYYVRATYWQKMFKWTALQAAPYADIAWDQLKYCIAKAVADGKLVTPS